MTETGTWIKLNRGILAWEWYSDANTMRVFVHLLLKANVKSRTVKNKSIKRGQLMTSIQSIAGELGMTRQNVRTAIDHLKETGEIEVVMSRSYAVVTIVNYDRYQDSGASTEKTKNGKPTKRAKKGKDDSAEEKKSSSYLPKEWELDIPKDFWGKFSTEDEWWDYAKGGDGESAMS